MLQLKEKTQEKKGQNIFTQFGANILLTFSFHLSFFKILFGPNLKTKKNLASVLLWTQYKLVKKNFVCFT